MTKHFPLAGSVLYKPATASDFLAASGARLSGISTSSSLTAAKSF